MREAKQDYIIKESNFGLSFQGTVEIAQMSSLSCPDQKQGQNQLHGSLQSYRTPHSEGPELGLVLYSHHFEILLKIFNKSPTISFSTGPFKLCS